MPMAVPLIAAAATVSAGITAGGIIGGMMIAGGVFSAAGALTGDKKLQRFGGILSLAGGVANLASNAMAAGNAVAEAAAADSIIARKAAEVAASSTAETVAGELASGAATAASGADALVSGGEMLSGGAEVVAESGVGLTDAGVATVAEPLAASPPGMLQSLSQQPAVPGLAADAAGGAAVPGASAVPGVADQAATAAGTATQGGSDFIKTLQDGASALGDKIKTGAQWVEKNPNVAKIGSQMLGSMAKYYGDQEAVKSSLELQEAARQRARDRLNASMTGVRVPVYSKGG